MLERLRSARRVGRRGPGAGGSRQIEVRDTRLGPAAGDVVEPVHRVRLATAIAFRQAIGRGPTIAPSPVRASPGEAGGLETCPCGLIFEASDEPRFIDLEPILPPRQRRVHSSVHLGGRCGSEGLPGDLPPERHRIPHGQLVPLSATRISSSIRSAKRSSRDRDPRLASGPDRASSGSAADHASTYRAKRSWSGPDAGSGCRSCRSALGTASGRSRCARPRARQSADRRGVTLRGLRSVRSEPSRRAPDPRRSSRRSRGVVRRARPGVPVEAPEAGAGANRSIGCCFGHIRGSL